MKQYLPFQTMSEEQLTALIAKLKDDADLRERFRSAADLEAAVAIARESGFNLNQGELSQISGKSDLSTRRELSDEELEVTGGLHLETGADVCWF
jgi:predicted ribosomally synthesized peptide with nif11-like leader